MDLTRREVIAAGGALLTASGADAAEKQADGKAIGIALVGGAHIHTPQYVEALKSRSTFHVKYVWDHMPERRDALAKTLNCKAVADPKEIWSDTEVAAVTICSETNRHHELVTAAAHAKKHMFVEKPLGVNAKEAYAMAAAIEKANLIFTTGYFMRTQREHIFLKEQVAKGLFGRVTRVHGSNTHNGSLQGWFDGPYRWMADPKIAGVGAFGDLGTHSLDILMWLFGPIENATADIQIITNRYPGCDETGTALFRFQSGIIGTLAAGWVDADNPISLEISGTEGHASIVNGLLYVKSSKLPNADGREPWGELPARIPGPIEQFLNAVEGKPSTGLVKVSEAAARVAVMEAAYQGSKTHAWVKPLSA